MSQQQEKKIITVFGATGKQGGAVVCALSKSGQYHIRAVARSRDESHTQKLREMGVEIVKANIATGAGLDKAFCGAYAAFLNTASFDPEIEGKEYECGRCLVDQARANGVKILIWSTLPNVQKLSNGKYNVPHFTEKARVEEYIRSLQTQSAFESVIFVAPPFYYQNFLCPKFLPKKDEKGCFVFEFPKLRTLTACDITDLGPIALKLFQNPHPYNGKIVLIDSENAPPQHYIETFQKVTGQKSCLKHQEMENRKDIHHAKQLAEMFAYLDEFSYFGQEKLPIVHAREIYPEVKNWETFLRKTGWKGEHQEEP